MKKQQLIFEKLKTFLQEQFGEELIEHDDGTHLTIGKSEIWIAVNQLDLIIGHGPNHSHFNPEWEDISKAVTLFFDILTKRIRIIKYYKGTFVFKVKTDVEIEHGNFEHISTSLTWLFPFWKKTKEEIRFIAPIIDRVEIEKEIETIKTYTLQL
jgi:hypothetical protein